MTNTENKKIDPVEFLVMYEKIRNLKPVAIERVNGFIEGISAAFDITVNQQDQKGG